jgi:sugar phosphate isomerase/epimerase
MMAEAFKFAFSANAFNRFPPAEAVRQIAELGYAGVELMFDEPHLVPAQADLGTVRAVREALDAHRLTVANVNAFTMRMLGDTWHPSWIEQEPERRRQRIEHTIAGLRLAMELGATSISTEPGGPLPEGASRDEALSTFVAGLAEVVPIAEETGVAILVEPEPHLLIETSAQFLDFIPRVVSPAVRLNFDIGHFYCVGEDPAEAFRALRPYVRHVHLEDIAATREHRHLVPGDGAIDLKAVLQEMRTSGYDGWITVELYPYQEDPRGVAERAIQYIRDLSADDADGGL